MALDAKRVVEDAINSIGLGYDLCNDLKFEYRKRFSHDSRLIAIDDDQVRDVELPDGITIPNVPKSIKCVSGKGDRVQLCSDALSFQQFNQELSLSGKIPVGHFNAPFNFSGAWPTDASDTKSLAFDGVSITLCDIAIEKTQLVLCDFVEQAVPSSWDPAALAWFIERYGTHVIVGLKMGGIDIIYAKQLYLSPLQPAAVKKKLKDMADTMLDRPRLYNVDDLRRTGMKKEDNIVFICTRKGGSGEFDLHHNEWCSTVLSQPDVISMSFIPITSLLSGTNGIGYLTHAINAYLSYKPPTEELRHFLEFLVPRKWAPVFGVLAFGPESKPQSTASSQINILGPKLYVNTAPVDVGKKPVVGLRLYLEGKRGNCLAIHLQHLSSVPKTFQVQDELNGNVYDASFEGRYFKKVPLKGFPHVCTAPVESDDDYCVVTGAHFEVGETNNKKVLFLRLHFSRVVGVTQAKYPQWVSSPSWTQRSGPAVPTQTPKLSRFVDTTETTRGPLDKPGYWVVSGARLLVVKDKISLMVKYSLLSHILP